MSWRAELRPRLSVRALSAAAGVALAVLTAALAGGVTWLSLVLDRTSEVLTRDAHSLQLFTEAELNLFAYHQASNLRLVTDDPQAIADADAVREALQRDIRAAVAAARSYAGPNDELELVERAAMEIEAYFAARNDLEAGQLDFDIVWTESRAQMRPAVETLDALRRINELEVERAQADAFATSRAVRAAAGGMAVVAILVLSVIAFWTRRALLKPIVAIRDAIERYREGEEPPRLGQGMARELEEIASAFDAMRETLARRRGEQAAFLAGVAHELRNPLFALQTSSAVLARSVPDEARPSVSILERQLAHLSRLVDELLEIGRTSAGRLELDISEVDLCDCVRAAFELYTTISGEHRLELDLPDRPVLISADARRIEQVVGNLVSNAIKYSPDGGTIRVSVSASGDEASITVRDEGIGIPRSEIEELFAPFRRRSTDRHGIPGAGLGLFVVKRIVGAHHGSIDVDSEPEKGSMFRVRLPLSPGTESTSAPG